MNRTTYIIPLALLLITQAVGCGNTYGGSARINSTVQVAPERARVYFILEDIWIKNGGEKMLEDKALIQHFQAGLSPAKESVKANRVYIIVAVNERTGAHEWTRETISTDNNDFNIEFPE